MIENPYLYRVTNADSLRSDQQGYVIAHRALSSEEVIDRRSIPMIRLNDLEFVARFLVFNGLTSGMLSAIEPFLVLQIQQNLVENYSNRKHGGLAEDEHFGWVQERAIRSIFVGVWQHDRSTSLSEKILKNLYGKKIYEETQGRLPVIQSALADDEKTALLERKK